MKRFTIKLNKREYRTICLFVLLTTVSITYLNHFSNTFQFDDSTSIENNIYIRDMSNIPDFFIDPTTYTFLHRYRPVLLTTFAIDYHLGGGLNPFYFHMSMFLFFIVQLILMFFLFIRILQKCIHHPWTDLFAFFAIAWYGLHTVNAETINYISARGDSLSTLGVVAGLYIFISRPRERKYLIYMIPVILGILIKEQATVFPIILFVYILLFERQKSLVDLFKKNGIKVFWEVFKRTLPSFIISTSAGLLVLFMQTDTYAPVGISSINYLITQPWVLLRYFIIFFLPVNLSPDTDWQVFETIFDERAIVGMIFIIVMILIAFRTSGKPEQKPIAFGILWFFFALLPTSSLIPLPEVTNDHRMFFPFVGLTLSVVWSIGLYLIKKDSKEKIKYPIKVSLFLILLIVLTANSYGVWKRNNVWHSKETLWYDVTLKSPQNGRGLMNYGIIQMEKGNLEIALNYFNKALLYVPYYPYLHINMAIVKNALNEPVVAEDHFLKAIQYGPNLNVAYQYYAEFLFHHNRIPEALKYAEYALKLDQSNLPVRYLLMNIYKYQNDNEKLNTLIEESHKINPSDTVFLGLPEKRVKN